ncbi:hypothetical protein CFOL_v3_08917, partial [Cephalotus follicularis]
VKEFYSNLKSSGDSCTDDFTLKTMVNGITIAFNDKTLGSVLKVMTEGSRFFEIKKWLEDFEFNTLDCLKLFSTQMSLFIENFEKVTNLLSVEYKLLHHFTATHILPIIGGNEKMSCQDTYVMWYVVTGKPLNLPIFLMKNMLRASKKESDAFFFPMGW